VRLLNDVELARALRLRSPLLSFDCVIQFRCTNKADGVREVQSGTSSDFPSFARILSSGQKMAIPLTSGFYRFWWIVGKPEAIQKRAPEELTPILLLPEWARVGSPIEMPVYGGAFRLAAVPVHHNVGRRFLRRVPWSIRRDTGSARFYVRWQ
jgi:hypothetical protein